jgi:hypothetical protein
MAARVIARRDRNRMCNLYRLDKGQDALRRYFGYKSAINRAKLFETAILPRVEWAVGQLDISEFPLTCAKCGHVSMRSPPQLRSEPVQLCIACKGDVSDEGRRMLRAIEAAERALKDDPLVKTRKRASLKFNRSRSAGV